MKNRKNKPRLYKLWFQVSSFPRLTEEERSHLTREALADVDAGYVINHQSVQVLLSTEAQIKVTLGSDRGVWYDIKDTPEEAEIMKKRSFYMTALKKYIQQNGLTTTDAVRIFGISPSRITSLMKDKINVFMLSTIGKNGVKGWYILLTVAKDEQ